MTQPTDGDLAYLLSLGFDLGLCQQALRQNASLQDATEWILDPTRPPTLNLGIDFSQPVASSSSLATSKPVISKNTPDQTTVVKEIQKKKFDRIAHEIKKDKLAEREARRRALLDIKEDREKQKRKTHPPSSSSSSSPSPSVQKDTLKEKSKPKERNALIQFKLSNSTTIRQSFSAEAKVDEVLQFVKSKESQDPDVERISLISAFPRRVYTIADANLGMEEAGFLPNVTLNVNIIAVSDPVESHENEEVEDDTMALDEDEEENHTEQVDTSNIPESDQARAAARQFWERRDRAEDTSINVQPSEDTVMEEVDEPEEQQVENTNDRRRNFLLAIEQRASTTANTVPTTQQSHAGLERHTRPLRETCSIIVAGLLTQHTLKASHYLKDLTNVSSDVAEYLLSYLIKNGKLNASTLRKLTDHCYLQHVVLDSYTYCTDSLIEDLAKSNSTISITKLSLRGCDVITDNGIRSLTGLRNLSYLDVNNCKVTDKGLKSLEKLSNLCYLNLSRTKITDDGISSLVANAKFKDHLEALLLDGCTRVKSSNTLVPLLNEFKNLMQLSLANTSIQEQHTDSNGVRLRANIALEQLDLSNTLIGDEDLIQIVSQLRRLVELKLNGCTNTSTRGLSFLPRELKNLKCIQFPNREHELDGVLSRFKGLPLEHLDLTGFLNITDEGVSHIAEMKHLRYLSLDGTKVTDAGVELLQDLIELEKLYLDRTPVTDMGISHLTGLSKLETLSLCRTGVSNIALQLLGDFEQTSFTRYLRTLNLAQCTLITDRGVRDLAGILYLTNLNLDHTSVSKSCLKYLKDLAHLKPVRLQGIEKEEDSDMEAE